MNDTPDVQQLLNVSVPERKAVVEPKGVLDDAEWKSVAVGLAVSYC